MNLTKRDRHALPRMRMVGAIPGDDEQQRQHWIPFFDDVQAIIFLAPLAFNLTLEEDPKVNRLVRNRCS